MRIAEGQVVTIEYTLRDPAGQVLESSEVGGPITFRLGSDRMLPGLAKALEGMTVGERRAGVIPPGQLVPRELTASRQVPLAEFPEGLDPKLGDRFQAKDPEGRPVLFEVTQKTKTEVTVQLLHILHDVELHYEVKVLAARRANLPPPPPVEVPDLTGDIQED